MINRRQFIKTATKLLAGAVAFPEVVFATQVIRGSLTNRIIQAESGWDSMAYREDTQATGLMQIKPNGALAEWNKYRSGKKYSLKDMFNPQRNIEVGKWYLHRILNHYHPHYKLDSHEPNVLASWNIGPPKHAKFFGDAIENFKDLPGQTKEFIKKVTGKNYS